MSVNPFDDEPVVNHASSTEIDLSEFDNEFGAAETKDFTDLPDGRYQAKIDRAVLMKSNTTGEVS